jgi:hypothetical protein
MWFWCIRSVFIRKIKVSYVSVLQSSLSLCIWIWMKRKLSENISPVSLCLATLSFNFQYILLIANKHSKGLRGKENKPKLFCWDSTRISLSIHQNQMVASFADLLLRSLQICRTLYEISDRASVNYGDQGPKFGGPFFKIPACNDPLHLFWELCYPLIWLIVLYEWWLLVPLISFPLIILNWVIDWIIKKYHYKEKSKADTNNEVSCTKKFNYT